MAGESYRSRLRALLARAGVKDGNLAAFEGAFPDLACTWLETEGSEDAVVLIEAADLQGRQ